MINFFRKTRQLFLTENPPDGRTGKFSKYLFYAIGEVFLVVFGILIALSIDNWNEDQNIRRTEKALLNEMKNELQMDLADMEYNIHFNKVRVNANEIVLESLKNTGPYNDTLNFYYANLMGGAYFMKNTSAFDNLNSMGFHIIKNDSLRIRITQLYSNIYKYADFLNANYIDNFYSTKLEPLIIRNIITDTIWMSAKPVNLSELAMNHEFKETIKTNIHSIWFLLGNYTDIRKEIIELIRQIDSEI